MPRIISTLDHCQSDNYNSHNEWWCFHNDSNHIFFLLFCLFFLAYPQLSIIDKSFFACTFSACLSFGTRSWVCSTTHWKHPDIKHTTRRPVSNTNKEWFGLVFGFFCSLINLPPDNVHFCGAFHVTGVTHCVLSYIIWFATSLMMEVSCIVYFNTWSFFFFFFTAILYINNLFCAKQQNDFLDICRFCLYFSSGGFSNLSVSFFLHSSSVRDWCDVVP